MSRPGEYSSALFLDTSMPAKQASPDASSGERLTQLVQLLNAMYPKFISSQRRSTNQLAFGVRKLYMLWQLLEGKPLLEILNTIRPMKKSAPSLSTIYHLYEDLRDYQLPVWCTDMNADCSIQQQGTRKRMCALLSDIFTSAPGYQQWINTIQKRLSNDMLHHTLMFAVYRCGIAMNLSDLEINKQSRCVLNYAYLSNVSAFWEITLQAIFQLQETRRVSAECIKTTCADPQNAEALANIDAMLRKLEELMKIIKPLQEGVLQSEYSQAIGGGSPSITK